MEYIYSMRIHMNRSRIQIAKRDIVTLFDDRPQKVFKQSEIARILADHRHFWRLAQATTVIGFVQFLMDSGKLTKVVFPFSKPYHRETRLVWGEVPLAEVMLSLKPNGHFSHYSAVQIHGLTEQIPKTTYINFEQALPSNSTGQLTQDRIDSAFRRRVRITSYVAETDEFRICLLNGKNTGYLGVVDHLTPPTPGLGDSPAAKIRVTNVERTLIDIAVRPVYAGGVHEVLKAYRLAQGMVSVNRLAAMLKQLSYIYPYHQVIGFYLDRAGYKPSLLDLLRRFEMHFDFYLTHQMKETQYVKGWRLHIPRGF